MNKFVWIAALSSLGVMVSATSLARDVEMSEKAAERLADFQVTGITKTCLGIRRIRSMTPLDDYHFLIRTSGRTYYLNEPSSKCTGANRSWNRIQYRVSNGQLCRGEIISIVDNSTGHVVGSCGLGTFQALENVPTEDLDDTNALR